MPNLDLNILNIIGGDTPVLKVMKGDDAIWTKYDAEVAYLESWGNAYIDTEIRICDIGKIQASFCYAYDIGGNFGDGAVYGSTFYGCIGLIKSSNVFYYGAQYGAGGSEKVTSTRRDGNFHTIVLDVMNGNFVFDNGTAISLTIPSSLPELTWWLFRRNNATRVQNSYRGAIKIWNRSGNLVHDFIPVKKGGIGYMYDKIGNKLFGSNGTDRFLIGESSSSVYDARVEYLEVVSDGTNSNLPYINTGIVGYSNMKIYASVYANGYCGFFWGGRTAASTSEMGLLIGSDENLSTRYNSTNKNVASTYNSWFHTIYYNGGLTHRNETSIIAANTAATFNTQYPIFLFATNTAGTPTTSTAVYIKRIGEYAILDGNGDVVMDLIPVRVGQVGYMYDKVTKQLFGNANSSGAFTFGNDV